MGCTLEEFLQDWAEESQRTDAVFENLNDGALSVRVSARDRSLGEIAKHLIESISEIVSHLGITLPALDVEPSPDDAKALVGAYRRMADVLSIALRGANPSMSAEQDVYGMTWTTDKTLRVLLRHEIHHRAQMMVLMRQAGLPLPDVYGPSRR